MTSLEVISKYSEKNGNSRENPVIAAEVVKGESRGISKKDSLILLIE